MKNKVRIAVVGTGYFSKFHFDAWMRLGVNIVAICSLNKNLGYVDTDNFYINSNSYFQLDIQVS